MIILLLSYNLKINYYISHNLINLNLNNENLSSEI